LTFALAQIQIADSLARRIANGRLGSNGRIVVKTDKCLASAEFRNYHPSLESHVPGHCMKQRGVIVNVLTAMCLRGQHGMNVTKLVMEGKVIVIERSIVTHPPVALHVQIF